jgi:hypothetical protein
MNLELLSKAEAAAAERVIDANFEAVPLPSDNLFTARWIVCTVGEDIHRFSLMDVAKVWHQPNSRRRRASFVIQLDIYKYALRHALDRCAKSLPITAATGPVPLNAVNYSKAVKLLEASDEFAKATRALSSYYAGSAILWIDRVTGTIRPDLESDEIPYSALEFLLGADKGGFSPIPLLVALFAGPEFEIPEQDASGSWAPAIHKIVSRAKLKNGEIRYQVITQAAISLLRIFDVAAAELPNSWMFPWGTTSHCQRYFAALQTISIYHLISIHFGAESHSLTGGGVDQLCLTTEIKRLNQTIARVTSIPMRDVEAITSALTLGSGTNNPDPALQPLIPVGPTKLAVPCIMVLSSNWGRNMLSLHARVSPTTFDADSAVFEQRMTADIVGLVPREFDPRCNIFLPVEGGTEEVDLVLIDAVNFAVLLVELKWTIQPGDIREVLARKQAMREKVTQTHRKLHRARRAIGAVTRKLGLSQQIDWAIEALVVIDGFGGIASEYPKEIPIVPKDILVALLAKVRNLRSAHAVLCTDLWLPRDGVNFCRLHQDATICGVQFSIPGFEMGKVSYMNTSLDTYISEALAATNSSAI